MAQFLSTCSANAMADAAANLLTGGLIAFPTETVYGLGADACNAQAVARIYSVKGRPVDHPLIVHIASMDGLGDWADDVPRYAISLARDFWPGPMTLVVKRSALAADFVTGGQDTVGIRVPNHPVALGLLEAFAKTGGKVWQRQVPIDLGMCHQQRRRRLAMSSVIIWQAVTRFWTVGPAT